MPTALAHDFFPPPHPTHTHSFFPQCCHLLKQPFQGYS
jgi:hypothetical protein